MQWSDLNISSSAFFRSQIRNLTKLDDLAQPFSTGDKMSSSIDREPLDGLIRQGQKVVGAICLPEADLQEFIEQFNHCYGPMQLQVSCPRPLSTPKTRIAPVGAIRRVAGT
ncbi:MAG: hypothetical protein Aurels2KO_36340 [Aureliella sp.]